MKRLATLTLAAGLAAALTAQAAPVMVDGAPGYPPQGMVVTPQMVFKLPGQRASDGVIHAGDVFASIGFGFKRTGVLRTDVRATNGWMRGVVLRAGTPGFYLGPASATLTVGGERIDNGQHWCFLPAKDGSGTGAVCLAIFPDMALVGRADLNPFEVQGSVPVYGEIRQTTAAIIDERPVDFGPGAHIEYRFGGWDFHGAMIQGFVGGRRISDILLKPEADGSVIMPTPVGAFRLTPEGGDKRRARLTLIGSPGPGGQRT